MAIQRELEKCKKAINGVDPLASQSDDDLSVVSYVYIYMDYKTRIR